MQADLQILHSVEAFVALSSAILELLGVAYSCFEMYSFQGAYTQRGAWPR